MNIPEIRLTKHFADIAKGMIGERPELKDYDSFRVIILRYAEPQLQKDMKDVQIKRCLRAAFVEVHREGN